MTASEKKKLLRREIRTRKEAMTAEERDAASSRITEAVIALPEFASARTVLLYSALPDEVQTAELIGRLYGSKRILLPVVQGEGLVLKEYSPECIHEGYRGIMEPDGAAPEADAGEVEFALIPGMAFDLTGGRLGRGGGFYDRLIPLLHCPKAGICYSCQIVDEVPRETFDIKVDKVLHE